MSQHDLDIANQLFPATRADINNALQALGSTSSGATVPSTTYANQLWYDTANNKLYIRNEDNDANIEICELDQSNDTVEYFKSDSIRTALVEYSDGTDAFTIGSDGTVAFDTNTLYVDATNNKVGIGTTSPDGKLHVETASSGATANTGADELVLEGTGNVGMSFLTSTTGANRIYFGDSGNALSGVIKYDHNIDAMFFDTNGSERIRIDSSGNVGIGTSSPSSPLEVVGGAPLASGFTQSRSGHPTFGITNGGTDSIYFHLAPSGGSHQTFMQVRDDDTDVDSIAFSTSGTEAMRIDSSGRLGIGTSSPDQNLHVSDTSTNAYIKIISNDSNTAGILFGDQNSGLQGKIYYVNSGDYMRFDTNASERMRIDSSGTVLMGQTTNPATSTLVLKVSTGSANGVNAQITSNTGTSFPWSNYNASGSYVGGISCTSSSTAFPTSSDYRLKENVDYTFDATSRLKQLKPCRFNFKIDTDRTVDGFIAHEVSDIVPEAIFGEKDAMETYTDDDGNEQTRISPQSIDQSKLVPLLVKTIQELEERITTLENN